MIKANTDNKHGIRIKGGISCNGNKFFAIIHLWHNEEGTGQPDEFSYPQTFSTSEEAMAHYIKELQPIVFEIAKRQDLGKITINAGEQLINMDWVKV